MRRQPAHAHRRGVVRQSCCRKYWFVDFGAWHLELMCHSSTGQARKTTRKKLRLTRFGSGMSGKDPRNRSLA